MKKILSLVLAFVFCFSATATASVSAGSLSDIGNESSLNVKSNEDEKNTSSVIEKLSSSLIEKMTPYMSNITVLTGSTDTEVIPTEKLMARLMTEIQETPETENATESSTIAALTSGASANENSTPETEKISIGRLAGLLKKYVFVKLDSSSELAEAIANDSRIEYHVLDDGNGTLYISVNIEENPEIFNYAVFRQVVENLADRQNEELIRDTDGKINYLMSYEHIAGELAVHMLLCAAAGDFLTVTNLKDERLINIYKSAAVADLNIDEARLPSEVIILVGSLIMSSFTFSIFRIFGLI